MHDPDAVQAPPPIKKQDGCPVDHQKKSPVDQDKKQCPVDHDKNQSAATCPVVHDKQELNQSNMMPTLNHERQADQQIDLPTDRVISSIPKTNDTGNRWEYPSPQQFYNALRRKGWETPEEEIETMVDIHNFLNEEAWNEVLRWESKFECECTEDPYLVRFQGRPRDLTPKARWHSWFGAPKPFDRHDWYIKRCNQERRYVIDYYEAPEEQPGVPVFHLDVRPALDDFQTIKARFFDGCKAKWDEMFGTSQ
ncbi:cytochrome c heme lyase [Hesseltinella vesiculosa]|uniref:Holocytochrome c-type synthase n=1 Tax=Hesseltinella vesiculosa TaxID=101127 RepID=A0A1X2GTK3_9FUNG|nr:cytochrome c heme lyase [Hesseltinella vesiculosa]